MRQVVEREGGRMHKFRKFFQVFCLFAMVVSLSGCLIAAVAYMGAVVYNGAKTAHPDVNFDKEYPETKTYKAGYDTTYQGVIRAIVELKEQTELTDKQGGTINTKKAMFGEEPSTFGHAIGKKVFYQRKSIIISRDKGGTSVTVKARFSQKSSYVNEEDFDDPKGENMVRASLFAQIDKIIGEGRSRTGTEASTPSEKPDQVQTSTVKIRQGKSLTNVRPAPTTKNNPIARLKGGTGVEKLEERGSWYKIRFTDSNGSQQEGWVNKSQVE
jgi:hypothetical protein